MLNFRLGKVIEYAARDEKIIEDAFREFFDKGKVELPTEYRDQVFQLFNEWLIFDFKLQSGSTVIIEYYLKNPDNLPTELMEELKQIIETQVYDCFDVDRVKPGEWVEVWGLFSGKSYRAYDVSLSTGMANKRGSFYNRVAKVNGKYYFVGCDPLVFSITYTDRTKKLYREAKKDFSLTPKDLVKLLAGKSQRNDPDLDITERKIKAKRKHLEKKFTEFVKQYGLTITFKKLTEFVYNENYQSHHADFYKDIIQIGVPEKMIFDNLQFFQDLWNYFPHKELNGKSPAEKYKEVYG